MKAFTVTSEGVSGGVPVCLDPYPHVPVGESGRGRHLERVALGRRDFPTRTVRAVTGYRYDGAQVGSMTVWAEVPDPPTPPASVEDTVENRGAWSTYTVRLQRWKEAHNLVDLRIHAATPIRTKERRTTLLVREDGRQDRRALVLLAVSAGFRGGTTLRVASVPGPCLFQGSDDGWSPGERCPLCGVSVVTAEPYEGAGWSRTRHPVEGVSPWRALSEGHDADGVKILAEGFVAQGDAGRMGGHRVVLVIMEPGSRIRVSRQGRLYGANSVMVARWDGEDLQAGPPDEVDPPGDEATKGATPL